MSNNPFRSGSKFGVVFGKMMELGTFTRKQIEVFASENGCDNPVSTVSMLFSPRIEDGKGDKRGNPAVPGHLYYVVKNPKAEKGKEHSFTFTLGFREIALEPRDGKKGVKAIEVAERKAKEIVEKAERAKQREIEKAERAEKKAKEIAEKAARKAERERIRAEKKAAKESAKESAKVEQGTSPVDPAPVETSEQTA